LSIFVDTSVWSLAFRREEPGGPFVAELLRALDAGEAIFATGLVVQEILQGVQGPRQRDQILERLSSFPLLAPDWNDHVNAADLFNRCRRAGAQIESVDALFAQLCVRYDLTMLTADKDFDRMARHGPLKVWKP